jgi:magnesium-protoporphyrin IX monomethyl ester (oxidative) cyclase
MSGKEPEKIKGMSFSGRAVTDFTPAEIITDLDTIPFPARDKLPMDKCLSFRSPRRENLKSASLITSRGCPFDCNFCSIHLITGRLGRKRSAENVLEEIVSLIKSYDIEHIEFEDDNLTVDRERAACIFQGIEKINRDIKKVSWSTPNGVKIDTLDKGLLEIIKKSNCRFLSFGIESGDPEILKKMNKNINLERVAETAAICKQLGIRTSAFFMIGYPGETKESFNKTILYVKKLREAGVGEFYYTVTRAYPGTKLFDFCRENNYLAADYEGNRIFLGNRITRENAIITPEFNAKTLIKRQALFEKATVPFYLRFYHRYFFIIKAVTPDRLIRVIKRLLKK